MARHPTFDDRPDDARRRWEVLDAAAASFVELAGSPEVGRSWTEPSALEGMTVGGLAAHVVAALGTVPPALERPLPDTDRVVPPFEFFGDNRRPGPTPADDERALAIVAAAEEAAGAGQAAVVAELANARSAVASAVAGADAERLVPTHRIADAVARLDDVLATRVVEVVVHGDDLAWSAGVVWHPPRPAADVAVEVLVGMARDRVGDLDLLRALTREERAAPGALRAL